MLLPNDPEGLSVDSQASTALHQTIAYFSMEIAVERAMPTYSGGLGVLAGDTLRSAADMGAPVVALTLLYRKGYFHQHLDQSGIQTETPAPWNPEAVLERLDPVVAVTIAGRPVMVRAWRHYMQGITGHTVPVLFLDTDLDPNEPWDRALTDSLYGGDHIYRLCQEVVLGIGGGKILSALGYQPQVFHMNEGHAALLGLGLLEDQLNGRELAAATPSDLEAVRQLCIFTTHTPVPAGHDRFGMDQMYQILGHDRAAFLEANGCCPERLLNMTYVALHFSRYVNGVAMQHGKVSQAMFPSVQVHSVTNGVHATTWTSLPFQSLFDRVAPDWRRDNLYLRSAVDIPLEEVLHAHLEAKRSMITAVVERASVSLREDLFTIGFARRAATYKRSDLLFTDPERLAQIAHDFGGLQIVYGGKAHPQDVAGKAMIRRVFDAAARLNSDAIRIVYIENYEWDLGAILTSGVDLWLNTPRRPYEASGTSGMKAALNGVPSLSTLDGWWIEGCVEGATGWAIADADDEAAESASLYDKLEKSILPLYYKNPRGWAEVMRTTISVNGSFFNTQRMLQQYISNAYFPGQAPLQSVRVQEHALTV